MEDFLKLVTDVGFPIAGAIVCGGFVFIILKFILSEITGAVKGLGGMIKSLENRVQTMNNDIVKIDTLVSYAFNKHPNLDRLAANEGKEDFVYYTWNWVVKEIKPVLDESTATLIGLIDRIRMLDNDMIRLNTKIQMILQEKEQKEEQEIKENRKRNRHILDTKL